MIAPLAKLLDWSALQIVWCWRLSALLKARDNSVGSRREEALHFLNSPDFLPAASLPAQLEFTGEREFRFPTPRPGEFPENNTAYGRLYRCPGRWQERPVIILLHGGGGDPDYHYEFPLIARRCNRAGFNVATPMAPFQFQRRPADIERRFNWPNWKLTAEVTFAQAIAEIRALIGWLLAEGCPAAALWGGSYGGQLAGIIASRDTRLAAAVLTAPGVNLNVSLSVARQMIWPRVRAELLLQQPDREALNQTPLNLVTLRPRIPKENILLIEAIHDLFVEPKYVEELWQAWDRPEIWRLPHSHASKDLAPGLNGRILRWLATRLDTSTVRTVQTTISGSS